MAGGEYVGAEQSSSSVISFSKYIDSVSHGVKQPWQASRRGFSASSAWVSPVSPILSVVAVQSSPRTLPMSENQTFGQGDRKSTRLNSSHVSISYAVFCL